MGNAKRWMGGCALVIATCLSGCESLDLLQVKDSSAPAYSATLISRPEEMRYGSGRVARGGVEFGYERYRGESVQSLDPSDRLRLEQGSIAGPQLSHNVFEVQHGHVAYNQLLTFGPHFELEPILGVAYERYKINAQGNVAGSPKLQTDGHDWAGIVAVTPRLNLNSVLAVEVRLMTSGDFTQSEISGVNPAFVVRPSPNVMFKAGYYTRDHHFDTAQYLSNVTSELSGFSGNITIVF